ncbi:hypothetical protein K1719_046741 [Acacia pycnantha]|nr:hypothetical protein K1719_046741 [Acacia pycnantha]
MSTNHHWDCCRRPGRKRKRKTKTKEKRMGFRVLSTGVDEYEDLDEEAKARFQKLSDTEPGSSSPLQRFPVRTASVGSNDSKVSKSSRLNVGSHSAENKLSQSVPSLHGSKQEKGGDAADTKARLNHDKYKTAALPEPKVRTAKATDVAHNRSPVKENTAKVVTRFL